MQFLPHIVPGCKAGVACCAVKSVVTHQVCAESGGGGGGGCRFFRPINIEAKGGLPHTAGVTRSVPGAGVRRRAGRPQRRPGPVWSRETRAQTTALRILQMRLDLAELKK